jgi:signal peptidase I
MYFLRWLLFRRFRMAAELCHQAGKLLNHQRDQLSPEAISKLREAIANLRTAMHSSYNRATLEEKIAKLEETGSRKLIPYRSPGMRENVEVALFAVAIAMSVRTFFFQPMGIPTGSMQPTLYGITEGNLGQAETVPTGVNSWVQHFLAGVSHHHLVSEGNWQLINVDPPRKNLMFFNKQRLTFRDTDTNNEIVRDISPPMNSGNSMLGHGKPFSGSLSEFILNSHNNYIYKKGEAVIKMRRESGDHLLIDRWTYNFRKPSRGDIIVFETKNIAGIDNDLFYIKRLAGLPNEKIRIGDDRHLVINDKRLDASDHPFELVYSFDVAEEIPLAQDSRFSGHVNQKVFQQVLHERRKTVARQNGVDPSRIQISYAGNISPNFMDGSHEFQIPQNRYLALGDNTVSSKDSRDWGSLPAKNIFGKAAFIYWPFLGQKHRTRPNRFGWAFQ